MVRLCFLDDNEALQNVLRYQIIGKTNDFECFSPQRYDVFVAIRNNELRLSLLEQLKALVFYLPIIIHVTAYVSPSTTLKERTCMLVGNVVHTNTVIEEDCIINVNMIVDHATHIQKGCHFVSGAIVCSHVMIGEQVVIGAGTCVKTNSKVPSFYQLDKLEVYKEEKNEENV